MKIVIDSGTVAHVIKSGKMGKIKSFTTDGVTCGIVGEGGHIGEVD